MTWLKTLKYFYITSVFEYKLYLLIDIAYCSIIIMLIHLFRFRKECMISNTYYTYHYSAYNAHNCLIFLIPFAISLLYCIVIDCVTFSIHSSMGFLIYYSLYKSFCQHDKLFCNKNCTLLQTNGVLYPQKQNHELPTWKPR